MSKGLEKVEQELTASDNDGYIYMGFQKVRKNEDSSLNKDSIPFTFATDLSISLLPVNSSVASYWEILPCFFPPYLPARLLWCTE